MVSSWKTGFFSPTMTDRWVLKGIWLCSTTLENLTTTSEISPRPWLIVMEEILANKMALVWSFSSRFSKRSRRDRFLSVGRGLN